MVPVYWRPRPLDLYANVSQLYKLMYVLLCFCPQTNAIIADDYSYSDQVSGIP